MTEKKPIFVVLSETHITEDIQDSELNIKGYNLLRCNSHSRHTGGVIVYVSKVVKYKVLLNENLDNEVWMLSVELFGKKHLVIHGVYRSQMCSENKFLNYLDNFVNNLNEQKSNVIVGDFNIDVSSDTFYSGKLKTLINDWGMKQVVNEYTRITKTSKTVIDLIITNNFNIVCKVLNDDKISDHETITIFIDNNINIQPITFRKLRYSSDQLNAYLSEIVINNNELNLEIMVDVCDGVLESIVEKFSKTITLKNFSDKEWYNDDLKLMKRERDLQYKKAIISRCESDWNEYNKRKKLYAESVRKSRNNFVRNQLQGKKGDQKGMWTILKSIIKNERSCNVMDIEFDGIMYSDSEDIANRFNNYFICSVKAINESIGRSDLHFSICNRETLFKFKEVTLSELETMVNTMKNKNDFDRVSVKLIKNCWTKIGQLLLNIINLSLRKGEFPNSWKVAVLRPIEKVKNSKKCADFRPINMLKTSEKILETVVKSQLMKYLEDEKIFLNEQSGYRGGHSCETALNYLIADWKVELDERRSVVCVFVDLKRAFETIDRKILIEKLKCYGVRGAELSWFTDYLSNRRQMVKFGECVSSELNCDLGVPQGSVLGAILFILYINDIKNVFKYCKIKLFADDTLIYLLCDNVDEAIDLINEDLISFEKWLKLNKLKLNVEKTKYLIISHSQVRSNVSLRINGENIEKVTQMKYLGCLIDDKLRFNLHSDYVCKKMAKKVNFFGRVSRMLDRETKITVYNTIIAPHINYCATILYLSGSTNIDRVQKLQNKAMRIILNAYRRTHILDMLNNLKWLSVYQKLKLYVLIFIYKVKNKLLPEYLNSCIQLREAVYVTRNVDTLRLPLYRKSATQNSLMYNGAKLFNDLPLEIRNVSNLAAFRKLCIDILITSGI